MKPRDYFPMGMAHGKAFCNRVAETQCMINVIFSGFPHSAYAKIKECTNLFT
jgi:hypothetical protein